MIKYVIFFCFLFPISTYGQGLNNNQQYDQTDIGELFQMNNISVYKFPLPYNDSVNKFNFVLYYYKDGALKDSFNYLSIASAEERYISQTGKLQDTVDVSALNASSGQQKVKIVTDTINMADLKAALSKQGKVKFVIDTVNAADLKPTATDQESLYASSPLETTKDSDNLLRVYLKFDSTQLKLRLLLNGNTTEAAMDFHELIKGSRAMVSNLDSINKRTRVLTIYGINKGGVLHCAREDSNDVLKKRMDELIVLYIEPIKSH